MNPIDIVAAQRDEANTKLRAATIELQAARAEIARLKGGQAQEVQPDVAGQPPPEVPSVTPPKSKRPRIFGG
jgi:outer membrane protein TolC